MRRTATVCSLVPLLAFSGVACRTAAPAATHGQVPAVQPAPATPPANDHSLGAEAYIEQGVPAPDRPWSGDDYARAAKALKEVAAKDPTQLPRRGGTRSGGVFARLSSPANIDNLDQGTTPPEMKLQLELPVLTGQGQLLVAYAGANGKGVRYGPELADLLVNVFHSVATFAKFFPYLEKQVSSATTDRPQREDGLRQMRDGVAQMTMGAMQSLTEKKVYEDADRARIAASLRVELPKIVPVLSTLTQKEVRRRVHELAGAETSQEVKEHLVALDEALSSAAAVQ